MKNGLVGMIDNDLISLEFVKKLKINIMEYVQMPLSEKNRCIDKASDELDQRFVKFKQDPNNHDFRD